MPENAQCGFQRRQLPEHYLPARFGSLRLLRLSIALASLLLVCSIQPGCSSKQRGDGGHSGTETPRETHPAGNPIRENRSRVLAQVLAVHPDGDTRYRLTLRVEKADSLPGYPGFAHAGDTLTVVPNYLAGPSGEMDQENETNRALLEGRWLKPGQRIRAVLYLQAGEGHAQWYLMALEK